MIVLNQKQILKPFILRSAGYVKSLISSEHVEMNNGATLQETVDDISGSLAVQIKKYTLPNKLNASDFNFNLALCKCGNVAQLALTGTAKTALSSWTTMLTDDAVNWIKSTAPPAIGIFDWVKAGNGVDIFFKVSPDCNAVYLWATNDIGQGTEINYSFTWITSI